MTLATQGTARVDHLIWATPDLADGVARITELLGVEPTPGGSHPTWGTRNHLVSLGPSVYLEIIGPDPEHDGPPPELWGIGEMSEPRLVTWCATGVDLQRLASHAVSVGIPLGEVRSGGRRTPDGEWLEWTLTDPGTSIAGGLVPFFIDWGETTHPASVSEPAGELRRMRAEHPEAEGVSETLTALGVGYLTVQSGPDVRLEASIETARGLVVLD